MKTCIKCGSHAFNLYAEGIDQGGFCDVHYWQGRAHRAEAQPALQVQPEQEPVAKLAGVAYVDDLDLWHFYPMRETDNFPDGTKFYTTPPQRPWVDLSDSQIEQVYYDVAKLHRGAPMPWGQVQFGNALQALVKEKNT